MERATLPTRPLSEMSTDNKQAMWLRLLCLPYLYMPIVPPHAFLVGSTALLLARRSLNRHLYPKPQRLAPYHRSLIRHPHLSAQAT